MTVNQRDIAIVRLAQGFSDEFAEYVSSHSKMEELMQELVMEFIEKNIPIVDEEAAFDVGCELLMSTTVKAI